MRISGVTYVPRRSHKARSIIITILVLLLIASLAVMIYSTMVGWKIIHPGRSRIDAISSNIAPEFKDITFKSKDNISLSGWYFTAGSSTRTVILAHGYGGNRLPFQKQTFDMVKTFVSKGYNVFTFDFRNSGASGGDKTTLGYREKDDLLSAISKAKSSGSKTIVLMGFSAGASASILAGAESSEVSAVIADSPFSDLNKYLNTENSIGPVRHPPFPLNRSITLSIGFLAGIDTSAVSPVSVLSKLAPRPLLLIHGKNDSIISCESSEELYNSYSKIKGAKGEIWEVDGAGHMGAFIKSPSEYMDKVISFLDQNVK